jgi:hypothetical protein
LGRFRRKRKFISSRPILTVTGDIAATAAAKPRRSAAASLGPPSTTTGEWEHICARRRARWWRLGSGTHRVDSEYPTPSTASSTACRRPPRTSTLFFGKEPESLFQAGLFPCVHGHRLQFVLKFSISLTIRPINHPIMDYLLCAVECGLHRLLLVE